ncbi:TasA family protein [Aquisalibacillus elongatus]|uniref:Camelysin n=1 Tax=Aquisalibacillus elongatus TaxID=485577 RepID=A0A3N5BWB0_9BACI|nr:TasA family protein [Aquisalibacillus elongatus]RPF54028.1 camelysin [Aquisalibacillus elongatus]
MNLKKKIAVGSITAALGLSLVAGGTYAAFNDVENTSADFAAGTLELDLQSVDENGYEFQVLNLKPGDTMTRDIKFVNEGSLAIKEVLMAIEDVQFANLIGPEAGAEATGDLDIASSEMDAQFFSAPDDAWVDQVNTDPLEYLDQFRVSLITLGAESGGDYQKELLGDDDNVTLKDFYLASDSVHGDSSKPANASEIADARNKVYGAIDEKNYIKGHRLNVTTETNDDWEGLPLNPYDEDVLRLKIEFIDNTEDMLVVDDVETDEYWQNIFQGNAAALTFSFEATQWDGQEITDEDTDENGYIETNEEANNGE